MPAHVSEQQFETDVVDALARRSRVWAVDLPGQPGLSSAAVVPVEDHAGWLAGGLPGRADE